ncbi:rRNA maturation RNase YbeY [Candidatus Roizmanbacteria bacterium]|nr:rRNA maturation RNase YbeY [Candidatus Roizmanbacteria bacterium]
MLNIVTSSRYKINRKLIKTKGDELMKKYNIHSNAVLNIIFVGKKKMKSIAAKYKNEDVALPVLSFSYLDNPNKNEAVIGEVIICYPQAILLAAEREKRVDDMLMKLITHGVENILK